LDEEPIAYKKTKALATSPPVKEVDTNVSIYMLLLVSNLLGRRVPTDISNRLELVGKAGDRDSNDREIL
jgi:hypothetical protein